MFDVLVARGVDGVGVVVVHCASGVMVDLWGCRGQQLFPCICYSWS